MKLVQGGACWTRGRASNSCRAGPTPSGEGSRAPADAGNAGEDAGPDYAAAPLGRSPAPRTRRPRGLQRSAALLCLFVVQGICPPSDEGDHAMKRVLGFSFPRGSDESRMA